MEIKRTTIQAHFPNDSLLTQLATASYSDALDIRPDTDYVLIPAALWIDHVANLPIPDFYTLIEGCTASPHWQPPQAVTFS
jgi:hypothetical protein